jgi:hypothetical protein
MDDEVFNDLAGMPWWLLLVTAVATGVGAVLAARLGRKLDAAPRVGSEEPVSSLPDRIEHLRQNLSQSSSLIDEINAELQVQVTALDRIRAEAEENQRLAALHKDEAEAVRQLIATTIEHSQGRATKLSKRSQWLFFLAGLLSSVPLGVGVNFLYDLITK